ncbi:DUF928 domain-containing protein [Chamaesiphon sp. OTE_8_metabat_110]|uniref:DUF928 domain-containing protein n=1 Tax=Chamaesiphon sp. OTE_8_metabat_110 TaxID=2964696 RepID=UPI00286D6408|nr:DUF928 domain-containing protein [Chamaesiphon sp. OTE_8_metabat_110]
MSVHSLARTLLSLTAWLLLIAPPLTAQTAPLQYSPDPTFSVLSRKGAPKDIIYGGGKRSICLTRADPARGLTAIVPPGDFGGLSATTNPKFWVYMPYATDTPLSGVLSVRTIDDFRSAPFIRVPVTLPAQPGLVALKLPTSLIGATSPLLNHPGVLAWTLTVVCDEENLSRNPFVSGLVMVTPQPALLQRVARLSRSEQVLEFARSGYWYDALDLVAGTDGEIGVQRLMESAGWKPAR